MADDVISSDMFKYLRRLQELRLGNEGLESRRELLVKQLDALRINSSSTTKEIFDLKARLTDYLDDEMISDLPLTILMQTYVQRFDTFFQLSLVQLNIVVDYFIDSLKIMEVATKQNPAVLSERHEEVLGFILKSLLAGKREELVTALKNAGNEFADSKDYVDGVRAWIGKLVLAKKGESQ